MRFNLLIDYLKDNKYLENEINKKLKWLKENKEKLEHKILFMHFIFDKEGEYFRIDISKSKFINISKKEIGLSYVIDEEFYNKDTKTIIDELIDALKN